MSEQCGAPLGRFGFSNTCFRWQLDVLNLNVLLSNLWICVTKDMVRFIIAETPESEQVWRTISQPLQTHMLEVCHTMNIMKSPKNSCQLLPWYMAHSQTCVRALIHDIEGARVVLILFASATWWPMQSNSIQWWDTAWYTAHRLAYVVRYLAHLPPPLARVVMHIREPSAD